MLLKSDELKIKKESEEGNAATFSFTPLPKGFGHTLGNSLRRILLSSMEGAAITQLRVPNVTHEFSTIPGVKEDLIEITLNLKEVSARIHVDHPVVGQISKEGKGEITAGDIEVPSDVEIVNKDLHIAELSDKSSEFEAEITFEPGVGYLPSEENETSKVGVILVDALFSPVVNVSYEVEPTRKGELTGLDKLLVTIETDGTVTPEEAVEEGATLLRNFFDRFARGEEEEVEEEEEEEPAKPQESKVLVDDLPLPTRTINALKKAEVDTLGKIADMSEEELADIKNLGAKSIEEINKVLEDEGLDE